MHSSKRSRVQESSGRGRQFREKWLNDYPWLSVNEEQTSMWCDVCRNNESLADPNSAFVKGTSNFNHPSFEKHEKSEPHRRCMVLYPEHPAYDKTEAINSVLQSPPASKATNAVGKQTNDNKNRKCAPPKVQSPVELLPPRLMQVQWKEHNSCINDMFSRLLSNEHFVDVTLTCEGKSLRCHKVVLSACSPYFETLLVENPCPHPIIFMKDIKYWEMEALVEFMYNGKVSVSETCLNDFIEAAQSLSIRGLATDIVNNDDDDEDDVYDVIHKPDKNDYPDYLLPQTNYIPHKKRPRYQPFRNYRNLVTPPPIVSSPNLPPMTKPLSAFFTQNGESEDSITKATELESNCEVMVLRLEPTDVQPNEENNEKDCNDEMEMAWQPEDCISAEMETESDSERVENRKTEKRRSKRQR